MLKSIVGWFIKRKLQDVNGQYYYKGVSVTKVSIVIIGVLKFAVEGLSGFLAQQGIIPAPIAVPIEVYEFVGIVAGVAARDAITNKGDTK